MAQTRGRGKDASTGGGCGLRRSAFALLMAMATGAPRAAHASTTAAEGADMDVHALLFDESVPLAVLVDVKVARALPAPADEASRAAVENETTIARRRAPKRSPWMVSCTTALPPTGTTTPAPTSPPHRLGAMTVDACARGREAAPA